MSTDYPRIDFNPGMPLRVSSTKMIILLLIVIANLMMPLTILLFVTTRQGREVDRLQREVYYYRSIAVARPMRVEVKYLQAKLREILQSINCKQDNM